MQAEERQGKAYVVQARTAVAAVQTESVVQPEHTALAAGAVVVAASADGEPAAAAAAAVQLLPDPHHQRPSSPFSSKCLPISPSCQS